MHETETLIIDCICKLWCYM